MQPQDVIDLDRYPIGDRDDPRRAELVARLKSELDSQQYCALPGFLRPDALATAAEEGRAARSRAFDNNARRNCYLHRETDPALPDDHPRNMLFASSTRMVAYDILPAASPMKTLYHWPQMREFVAEVVSAGELHESADPYQPVNLLCYDEGDRSTWHFDSSNAFTMTLMLQAPEAGGEFELVPNTRSDDDENYDYVREVLVGERPNDAVQIAREPGALCIFRGCNSLHRVRPVEGSTMRIMAVFVYEDEPGVVGDPRVNATIYGPRAA